MQCHEDGEGIEIHHAARINAHTHLLSFSKITIHEKVLIAPFCLISSGNHVYQDNAPIMEQPMSATGPVVIRSGVWLGQNAKILGRCYIGENSVVAAGSVVKGQFEPRSLLAGVPAKTMKAM
ncbi:MAG: acyltransferase [Bacteriovorax sp.]